MSYDLSQIKSDSKLVNMLIEMDSFIQSDKLSQKQLPYDDLSEVIVKEVIEKNVNEKKTYIVLGALESLLDELKTTEMTKEDFSNHVRQLLFYIL